MTSAAMELVALNGLKVDSSAPMVAMLDALATHGVVTVQDLRVWSGGGLVLVAGPNPVQLVSIMTKVAGLPGVPADDDHMRTLLAKLCFAAYEAVAAAGLEASTAKTGAAEAAKHEAEARQHLADFNKNWGVAVPPNQRCSPKMMTGLVRSLKSGDGFTSEQIELKAYAPRRAESVISSTFGGVVFDTKTPVAEITSVVQAVINVVIFTNALHVAGNRACVAPVTKGTRGWIASPVLGGPAVQVHCTPNLGMNYVRLVLDTALVPGLTGEKLAKGHALIWERISVLLAEGHNLESAYFQVIDACSLVSALSYAGEALGTNKAPGNPGTSAKSDLASLAAQVKLLAARTSTPERADKRRNPVTNADPAAQTCGFFNRKNGCVKTGCDRKHACSKCAATDHGRSSCPN